MRPEALPARFEEALEVVGDYASEGEDRATLERVEGLRPAVREWSERLAALPGEASLDHNDLHPANVFAPRPGGRTRFFDWGDSVVAHPFSSMLVALDFMRHEALATTGDDPRLLCLRDAYLEGFTDLAPHAELVETTALARRLALIPRTLIWARATAALEPEAVPEDWARAPFETLVTLLDA
jgi:aminoglycoside phosphotransferase (APT) family kinase protein